MAEEVKSNLEPIEEADLNLREKFLGGPKSAEVPTVSSPEAEEEKVSVPEQTVEQTVERKEGQMEKDSAYNKILSKASSAQPAKNDEIVSDASAVSKERDVETKISSLVQIAETKGVPHAVKVARHYQNNYILDELHDRLLAEGLHDALVKKGLIKEI